MLDSISDLWHLIKQSNFQYSKTISNIFQKEKLIKSSMDLVLEDYSVGINLIRNTKINEVRNYETIVSAALIL